MQMEVTSFSRKPETAFAVPASIHVITSEDIRRSGVTSLPQALRLAPNLSVAQVDSRQWAISARGFNGTVANKLLVLIDGRSVYTPLYSGVFWDVQNADLGDIDRIEVTSGPGATLWGTNAVNGVINIITKDSKDPASKGLHLSGTTGTRDRLTGIRYGGSSDDNTSYRVYLMDFYRGAAQLSTGVEAGDAWRMTQGGFKVDWDADEATRLTIQGDAYGGSIHQRVGADVDVSGGNLVERWSHTLDNGTDYSIQAYYDLTHRTIPNMFGEDLETMNIDAQYRFPIGEQNDVVVGGGFRHMNDRITNSASLAFLPDYLLMRIYSGFIQDEISLFQDRAKVTLGSKFEHNDFSGFEYQPSVKLAWLFDPTKTAWAAFTRAVRTPSRIDRDFYVPAAPPFLLAGGVNFNSEKVYAYEVGYRHQLSSALTVEAAAFYNFYDDLRSVEPGPPYTLQNGLEGTTYGAEAAIHFQTMDWWQWKAAYCYFQKEIRVKPWSRDLNGGLGEGDDPRHRFSVLSYVDLPGGIEFDTWLRVTDELPRISAQVPGYAELDLRLGWKTIDNLTLSIVGQNLLHDRHPEMGAPANRREIPRNVYGSVRLDL
ncbi:MAG TPA: TonB-dependent receptor [Bacteroidota bacterium]|nr:TonB-dependent receptor [Bacteroidota bacterium]